MIFVTWRLRGSLAHKPRCATAKSIERALDRKGSTSQLLAEPAYANRVREALLHGDHERGLYDLHAWVILHNHAHVLLDPYTGTVRIAETVMSASELASARRFWERESWERPVHTRDEYLDCLDYIHEHPVRDGLVESAEQWPWSSAGFETAPQAFEPRPRFYPYVSGCQQASLRM